MDKFTAANNFKSNISIKTSLNALNSRKEWVKPTFHQIDFKLTAGGTGSTNVDAYKQS